MQAPKLRARPATAGLIVVCTVVYLACMVGLLTRADAPGAALLESLWNFDDVELLQRVGALAATSIWLDGEWWRVVSAGLLHGSWLHLGLNMLGLWAVGQWTEKVWGGWRQLVLFGLSSVGGCLASLAWAEAPLVVGASAGIFGVAGALVVARAWGRDDQQAALKPVSARVLGFWLVFWLVVGALLPWLFGISLLAQAGHIGGLVIGCLVGWGFSARREQRYRRVASGVLVGASLAGLVAASVAPAWRVNYQRFMGAELLARGEFEPAAKHFDRALEQAPDDPVLANAVAYALAEAGVDLERAEELVRRALDAEPESADYLDTLGWIQCKLGQTDAGIASLERAAESSDREIPEIQEHIEACPGLGDVPRGTAEPGPPT